MRVVVFDKNGGFKTGHDDFNGLTPRSVVQDFVFEQDLGHFVVVLHHLFSFFTFQDVRFPVELLDRIGDALEQLTSPSDSTTYRWQIAR